MGLKAEECRVRIWVTKEGAESRGIVDLKLGLQNKSMKAENLEKRGYKIWGRKQTDVV